ncbi:MAG: histidine phosphatase family protein [Pseudomonadaceae bacterium]|nr:MAG: histidine phosphatase family protein [Pseudomonadaceae bacterium]
MRWIVLLLMSCWSLVGWATEPDWLPAWRDGQAALLMRHAMAPGVGDPAGFQLGDCGTQRNLNAQGRDEARRWGEWLLAHRVEPRVLTSRWCRARDTAAGFSVGQVDDFEPLDSFFRRTEQRSTAIQGMRELLAQPSERPLLLVSHQVNITALTGLFPASAEVIVIALPLDGEAQVLGRMPVP